MKKWTLILVSILERDNNCMSWKKLKTQTISKTKWLEICEDDVITPSGSEGKYTYVNRKHGVSIALLDGEFVHMVSQYRYPIKKTILQFVLESMEGDEKPKIAAKRGIEEELGVKVEKIEKIGEAYVDAGLNVQKIYFFVAEKVQEKIKTKLESTEIDLKVHKVKIKDLNKLIDEEKIQDFHTVAGVYYLLKYLSTR
jgi:ADP-ribose pyrophosphatase